MKNFVRRSIFSMLLLLPFVTQGVMAQSVADRVVHLENGVSSKAAVLNSATYQGYLNTLFANKQCTQLKAAYDTQAELTASEAYWGLPGVLRDMAMKVCTGNWAETNSKNSEISWSSAAAKRFRVQSYEPHSITENVCGLVGTKQYGNMNNPTGIYADDSEVLYIMVGSAVPAGASLYIASLTDASEGYLTDYSSANKIQLSQGLNMISVTGNGNLQYILYGVDSQYDAYPLTNFPDIEIQIAGGSINGMYELGKDSGIYEELKANAAKSNITYFNVLGQKYAFHTSKENVFKGGSDESLTRALRAWDEIMLTQHLVMGIKTGAGDYTDRLNLHTQIADYSTKVNNRVQVHSKASIAYYIQLPYCIQFGHGESWLVGDNMEQTGQIWGPAHETGHINQTPINMIGTTEISTNLFSNVAVFYQNYITSRGGSIADNNAEHMNGTAWHFRDSNSRMRMYYQLWLYYHAAGHNKNFYPELFRLLRNNPMSFHNISTSSSVNYTSTESLRFYQYACQAAGEDLTPFFEAWGFFIPFGETIIEDYSQYKLASTQSDINVAKSAVAAKGYQKNYSILFIEDRIGEANIGDRGQYTDYQDGNGNDPDGEYTYLVQGNRILMFSNSGNGAGYVITDGSGNIIAFSNSDEFEVSDAIANNLKKGTYTLSVYGTTVGSTVAAVNVENSSNVDAQKVVLGVLLDNIKAVLDITDATNTKIGYYKSSYVTSLQNAYDEAKAIYESNTASSAEYATQISTLNKEYDILMSKGDYAKVGVVNGSIYTMQNRGQFENNNQVKVKLSMALNGSDVDGRETANVETQRWIFEATGTTGYYYIKNKSKGVYVGKMVQNSTQVTATETTTANAGTYRVVIKEPGLVAIVDENNRALHIDANQNVVGWTEDATNSQWYMTAVELSELGKAKEELDALIGETSWAINEIAIANITTGAVSYIKPPYDLTTVDGVYPDKAKVGTACQAVRSAQLVSDNIASTAADYAAAYEALLDDYYYLMGYYNTATGVNLDVEKEALQEAIDAVQSYLNDMDGGSGASKVELTTTSGQPGYVSSNACQNTINPTQKDGQGLPGLIDNDSNYLDTYFHSQWSGTNTGGAHYIQVDLGAGNELANFKFNYSTRSNPHAIPSEIVISGSTDGVSFTPIKTLNKELPGGGEYSSYTGTADYSLNSTYATDTKTSSRKLSNVKLVSSTYGEQTASLTSQTKVYNDLTSTTFKAAPGETISASFTKDGNVDWIHGYIYIDEGQDGFTAGVTNTYVPTGDLKSYSFYGGSETQEAYGYNSAGTYITNGGRSTLFCPDFTAPTTPGLYRMRYKMDWNSIDPKGNTTQNLTGNNGNIIDVMLKVQENLSGVQTYESDVISTGAFYRYLRFTVTESACYQDHSCTGITHTSNGNTYYCFALADFGLTRIDDNSTEDTWVSEELKRSAQNEINDAQNVHDNAKTAIELVRETEAMEALLANLKNAQQLTLPVKLTTNPATPYLYQVEVKEVNGESDKVWQYDTSASSYTYYNGEHNFVSHATSDPSNTNQAWYFMKGTETGQVYIYPYNAGGKLLAVDQTMYDVPNANGRIYSYAKDDISNYVQEWTFVDCGDGTYNIRPAISGTNYYVAMCAQLPGTYKLGFKDNGSNDNTKFIFNSVKPTASAAWNQLNNYVNAHPEVPGSTQLFATSLASANAYNTLRREAVALLETAAADDVLTEMYNNLVAAYAAITANQPSAEKLYYIRSASSDVSYKDVYVYNASSYLKWTDTAADDNSAVWTIIPNGGNEYKIRSYSDDTQYWRNYDSNLCATTSTYADALNIELIPGTNGQVNIYYNNSGYGYAAYNVAAGNNIVQTSNTKGTAGNTAAFYLEELPSDKLSALKSYQLSMTHWRYAGLYLDFTTVLPETMEAYVITEEEFENVETEGSTVTATVVLRQLDCPNRVLPANTGVILKLKSHVDLEEGATIYHTFAPTDEAYGGNAELVSANKLKGSAEDTYVVNTTNPNWYEDYNNLDFYVFGVKNGKVGLYKAPEKYEKSGSDFVVGYNWESNDANNEKLKYYIKCSANKIYYQTAQGALQGASGSSRLKFRIAGPDDEFVTDIEEVETETQQNQPEAIYDLQGRRVERITAPGLYIVNGKKHYVKAAKF